MNKCVWFTCKVNYYTEMKINSNYQQQYGCMSQAKCRVKLIRHKGLHIVRY